MGHDVEVVAFEGGFGGDEVVSFGLLGAVSIA